MKATHNGKWKYQPNLGSKDHFNQRMETLVERREQLDQHLLRYQQKGTFFVSFLGRIHII